MLSRARTIRVLGAVVVAVAAATASVMLGLDATADRDVIAPAEPSAIAFVSNQPVRAFVGEVNFLNIDPEEREHVRLSIEASGLFPESEGAVMPDAIVTPLVRGGVPADGEHLGFSLIVGGRLAEQIRSCDSNAWVTRDLRYSDLSETERNSIVANLEEQERNRLVAEGGAQSALSGRFAIDVAQELDYVAIDYATLGPASEFLSTQAADPAAVAGGLEGPDARYVGYTGITQCETHEGAARSEQPWGQRFDILPLTTASVSAPGALLRVESILRIFRWRALTEYRLTGSTGGEDETWVDAWAGQLASERTALSWTEAAAATGMASVGASTYNYEHLTFSGTRDMKIFAAGALLSLAAAMGIAIAKTFARHGHEVWGARRTAREEARSAEAAETAQD